MQFVVMAQDGRDVETLERRLKVREAHFEYTEQHKPHMIMGVATLNNDEEMNGSIMIVDFPSKKELETWLNNEPYVVNDVWRDIVVTQCRVGPTFLK